MKRLCLHVLFVAYLCTRETGCVILTSSVEESGLVCPGEEVTFTCTVIEQPSLGWKNEQYIVGEIIFLHHDQMKLRVPEFHGPFLIVLTSLSPSNSSQVANMTSTLTVHGTLTLNGTVVKCDDGGISANASLHVAGVFLLFQHLSTWQIIMVVVFPILTSVSATFVIAMFTLMCWRKHKSLQASTKKVATNPSMDLEEQLETGHDTDSEFKHCYDPVTKHSNLTYSELGLQPQNQSLIPPPEHPTSVQYSALIHKDEERLTRTTLEPTRPAVRVTKKSQGVPEQPGPVYAEVQPGTSDAHLEMKKNVAYSPIKLLVSGKFEMGDNVAYGIRSVGH